MTNHEDELFAAIATKVIEFAGLDDKAWGYQLLHCQCFRSIPQVKIWMGTVHSEIANITHRRREQFPLPKS